MLQRTKNPSFPHTPRLFPEHPLLGNDKGKTPDLDHLPRELRELAACIHQNLFDPDLNVKRVREMCRVRDNNISSRFRRAMGMGIKSYIDEHRMAAASILLLSSDLSIFDVAMEVGFAHVETFYQVFRRQFGCTPGAYRANKSSAQTSD